MGPGDLGRGLMILGGLLFLLGGIFYLSGRGLPLGNLPGDIYIRRPGFTLYVPLTTGILISLALSLVLHFLFRR